jgi:hypothetical protein
MFLKVNFSALAPIKFGLIVSLSVVQFITSFYKNEVMNILTEKMKFQEEIG